MKRSARAYTRDVVAHLRHVENSARFAEYYGAPVKDMREIRTLAEALRRKAAEVERGCRA